MQLSDVSQGDAAGCDELPKHQIGGLQEAAGLQIKRMGFTLWET